MELPRRLVDTAQIRNDHHGILFTVVTLTLHDSRVVIDRIAGVQGDLVANGYGLPRRRCGSRGRAIDSTDQLRLTFVQGELERARREVEDRLPRMRVRGDTPSWSKGNAKERQSLPGRHSSGRNPT